MWAEEKEKPFFSLYYLKHKYKEQVHTVKLKVKKITKSTSLLPDGIDPPMFWGRYSKYRLM